MDRVGALAGGVLLEGGYVRVLLGLGGETVDGGVELPVADAADPVPFKLVGVIRAAVRCRGGRWGLGGSGVFRPAVPAHGGPLGARDERPCAIPPASPWSSRAQPLLAARWPDPTHPG